MYNHHIDEHKIRKGQSGGFAELSFCDKLID